MPKCVEQIVTFSMLPFAGVLRNIHVCEMASEAIAYPRAMVVVDNIAVFSRTSCRQIMHRLQLVQRRSSRLSQS